MWKDLVLDGALLLLALGASVLLYRRTRMVEILLSNAPPSPVVVDSQDSGNSGVGTPYFLLVTSPHVCAVDGKRWTALINLARKKEIPFYGWVLARPDLPETSLWLESMQFPFPVVRLSHPVEALSSIQGMLGPDPWNRLPALLLVYHGRVVAVQSMATLDLQDMVWLFQVLKSRERWPWFF